MSRDPSAIPKSSQNSDSSGYNNDSFNTHILNNNKDCFNTITSNVSNITVTNDRSEILTWLSPLEPNKRHEGLKERRVEKVGDWLLRTEQFQSWRSGTGQGESQKATIFCSGNPGVGKAYIR